MNREITGVQPGLREGRATRYQIANIHRALERSREFQKSIYFCLIHYVKLLTCDLWITTNFEKFLKRWEYQTTFPVS